MTRLMGVICILALTSAATVRAEEEDEGQIIVVTGSKDGYRTLSTEGATKTNTPLLDVPQSISVVTSQQMQDQNLRTMADIVRMIPGVSAGQGEGHRDQISLRGNNSSADFFLDGLRDDAQYIRSFYNIERVEAHKGPNAMIFGRGGGGGVINRVIKSPVDHRIVKGTTSINSFGSGAVEGDINHPFANGAVRINGYFETLGTHRDVFSGERLGINPVLGANLEQTKVQLGYEYVQDDRVVDRGVPSAFTGTLAAPAGPATGLRDQFFGVEGVNISTTKAHILTAKSKTEISNALTVSAQFLFGDYDKIYTNAFAATAIGGSAAFPTLGIEAYRDPTTRRNVIGQVNLEWRARRAVWIM